MNDERTIAYVLIVLGLLWTLLGGMCEGLGIAMAVGGERYGARPDWVQITVKALWLVPGLAAWIGGERLLRAVRKAERKSRD